MKKTEIKERLEIIEDLARDTITNLKSRKAWYDAFLEKVENLSGYLEDEYFNQFEKDDLITSVTNQLFEDELDAVYHLANELLNDVLTHANELSELKQEKFLERYDCLEEVQDKFNQDYSEYEDIDLAIEHIEDAIELIKGMY